MVIQANPSVSGISGSENYKAADSSNKKSRKMIPGFSVYTTVYLQFFYFDIAERDHISMILQCNFPGIKFSKVGHVFEFTAGY